MKKKEKQKHRERIIAEMKEQGLVTTDERLEVIKWKIDQEDTPMKDRMRILDLIRVINSDEPVDFEKWFKELKALTDDKIKEI